MAVCETVCHVVVHATERMNYGVRPIPCVML
jgi:hypothetical protein